MTVHGKGNTVSISIPRDFAERVRQIIPRLPLQVQDKRRENSLTSAVVYLAQVGIETVAARTVPLDAYSEPDQSP